MSLTRYQNALTRSLSFDCNNESGDVTDHLAGRGLVAFDDELGHRERVVSLQANRYRYDNKLFPKGAVVSNHGAIQPDCRAYDRP